MTIIKTAPAIAIFLIKSPISSKTPIPLVVVAPLAVKAEKEK